MLHLKLRNRLNNRTLNSGAERSFPSLLLQEHLLQVLLTLVDQLLAKLIRFILRLNEYGVEALSFGLVHGREALEFLDAD